MWAYEILELGDFTDGLWKVFHIDQVWITILCGSSHFWVLDDNFCEVKC